MKRGMIKMLALKIIHEEDVTGYDLMKRIEKISGRKPSSGTIYPMLKGMADDGWITRHDDGSKAIYSITEDGKRKMAEFRELKSEYMGKIMETMSIARETLDTESVHGTVEILLPFFIDVKEALEDDVPPEKIAEIVKEARDKLRDITKEMKE